MVRDPAEDQRAEQAGEESGAEHAADLHRVRMPFAGHSRHGDCCRADIVSIHHHDEEGDDDEPDVKGADLLAIDDRRKIDGAYGGHGVPRDLFLHVIYRDDRAGQALPCAIRRNRSPRIGARG